MSEPSFVIDPNETLNALIARRPEALPVLQHFGLDTCCGGGLPLAVAAQHHNLPVERLLAALYEALGEGVNSSRATRF